jgi:carbon storage regulator CsrA
MCAAYTDRIRITILGVTRGTVKIGLEAPNNVRILRGEPKWMFHA